MISFIMLFYIDVIQYQAKLLERFVPAGARCYIPCTNFNACLYAVYKL